jgi:haloacetate dehalogenase
MEIATRSRSEEEMLERRSFLGALAGASLGVLSEGIFTDFANAQDTAQAGASSTSQISFETSQVDVSGNTIFLRRYGKGPAILLVHGFPRTSLMWRFLAPKLDESHTVICTDLRATDAAGYPLQRTTTFPIQSVQWRRN